MEEIQPEQTRDYRNYSTQYAADIKLFVQTEYGPKTHESFWFLYTMWKSKKWDEFPMMPLTLKTLRPLLTELKKLHGE
jgi:hypothetical protein